MILLLGMCLLAINLPIRFKSSDPLNHLAREIIRILHDLHVLLEQQLSMALDTSFSERVATAACLIAFSHVRFFQRFYSIPVSSSIYIVELRRPAML